MKGKGQEVVMFLPHSDIYVSICSHTLDTELGESMRHLALKDHDAQRPTSLLRGTGKKS